MKISSTLSLTKEPLFKGIPASISKLLFEAGSACVHEARGRVGMLPEQIRSRQVNLRLIGRSLTIQCPSNDNLTLHAAIANSQPGDVFVVKTHGEKAYGMFGELLALAAQQKDIGGIITTNGVRDIETLRSIGFPVWSKFVHAQGTTKDTLGTIGEPIQIGDTEIHTGDYIIADEDGICICPRDDLDSTLESIQQIIEKEKLIREKLLQGIPSRDVFGLRKKIEEKSI